VHVLPYSAKKTKWGINAADAAPAAAAYLHA